ncbi:MAG: hypothetical protein JRI61_10635 [Deltaproteobacteria bacterium]|nr:hypothetical protein [Deltaproteobacteria bacterium]
MEILTDTLIWIGSHFSYEVYHTTTKVQGIFWSLADIAIIWYMLKIADFIRNHTGESKITWRYYLLLITAVLTPVLLVMKTAKHFFILEAVIFAIQYLLLMYSVIAEKNRVLIFIKATIQNR